MLKKPFLSVIIPTLNEEKALPLLLKDLQVQTTDNFEVIIVDGYSTDKTLAKAKKFSTTLPKLTLLTSDKRNVGYQRNRGGEKASGAYLLFIDADTRLPNYFFEGVGYHLHLSQPDIFTFWCIADSNSPSDKTITTIINIGIEAGLLTDNPYASGTLLGCSKKTFITTHGFNPKIAFAEDTEFVRRCYKKGLKFEIFKNPRYTMSLRRFRQTGTIKAIQKYTALYLKLLTQRKINQPQEYPMGGNAHLKDQTANSFFSSLDHSLKNITQKPKTFTKIRSLISSEK